MPLFSRVSLVFQLHILCLIVFRHGSVRSAQDGQVCAMRFAESELASQLRTDANRTSVVPCAGARFHAWASAPAWEQSSSTATGADPSGWDPVAAFWKRSAYINTEPTHWWYGSVPAHREQPHSSNARRIDGDKFPVPACWERFACFSASPVPAHRGRQHPNRHR